MTFEFEVWIAAIIVVDGSVNHEQMLEASGLIDSDYLMDDFDMMMREIQHDVGPDDLGHRPDWRLKPKRDRLHNEK